ncbi:vacuolar import and degradation protein-domain-containing protein [Stachybotrys elegans]|uniref:Vacuolar import and degradation protein-domain-containing protein n=1 Tax=Stachybotrys elegans TaxID=80388 RepID=A0A8K0SIA2_9HYPO|nr:vacuolar import and degradation protein-domain-containing protein [Stachybotrys elegans]
MPTPSSDPPSDPLPSAHSALASTCPDDLPQPSHQSHDGGSVHMEVQHEALSQADSPQAFSRPGPEHHAALEVSMTDEPPSVEPSSRSTTLSPQPQSGITGLTSPEASGVGSDLIKPDDGCTNYAVGHDDSSNLCHTSHADNNPGSFPSADTGHVDMDILEYDSCYSYTGSDPTFRRCLPVSPSSFLRPGSRFHGTQQSERQVYDVQVEIKHVDMRESFLCGYLRIQGLTEDHPTLTTYFEGEIIGSKYSFLTQHDDWGANSKVDLNHWAKFNAFRPFQKHARRGAVPIHDIAQKENIFMRWKEHFLVPDHRVRTITGASFEGFYYICFNQVKGEVSGIYFHSKSEKFQQLELKHVPDRGCLSATEFR